MPKRLQCDTELLRSLYFDKKMSAEEAGRLAGLGQGRSSVVLRRLRLAGYVTRKSSERPPRWSDEEVVRLYTEACVGADVVAEKVGCSPTHARRILKRMGAIRPRGASTPQRRGENAPRWAGGRHVSPPGYVFLHKPKHRQAIKSGYVAEHRMVMSDILGRRLDSREEVHHINGVHSDNRPENLTVIAKGKHQRLHAEVWRELWRLRQDVARLSAASCQPGQSFHKGSDWRVVG